MFVEDRVLALIVRGGRMFFKSHSLLFPVAEVLPVLTRLNLGEYLKIGVLAIQAEERYLPVP